VASFVDKGFLGMKSGIFDTKCSSLVQRHMADALCSARSGRRGAGRDDRRDGRAWKRGSDSTWVSSDHSDGSCWMHKVECFESDSMNEGLGGRS
jgi:hypothetical protein